ncbi:MAG: alanine dehydrogenase [Ignavibacteriaceae bacterium]
MLIGVPKEIKSNENRVALLPVGASTLIQNGHKVVVETNAGTGSGFSDDDYKSVGAEIASTPEEIFANAEMIMKVKEPIDHEYDMIREGQIVFTYFHFAASKELTEAMMKNKCVAIAYETVQKADRSLPLLIPMSEVAGRMAPQEGAKYLEKVMGGRGVLLGGVPGTGPAEVMILGGGIVGTNAAKIAAGLGARVMILDSNLYRLRYLDDVMPKNVTTMMSNEYYIRENLQTCHPTTHEKPTYIVDGVVHYCVANMPGAVPHTSTLALTHSTLPYAVEIANKGFEKAIKTNHEIKLGLNIVDGKITYKGVAEAFNLDYHPVDSVIN